MWQLNVWYRDEDGESVKTTLRNLKPRRYMCSWSFDRVMKYAKEELYWEDIKEEDVIAFEIENKKEQWCNGIPRPE